MVQEAVVEALRHWPAEGIPQNPGAWLMTTARRKALDRLRRGKTYMEKLSLLVASSSQEVRGEQDDRLRLIFTCCHPALSREAQVALTLRAVIGLTTPEIARAFLISEATMAQRIVRAKRKIVEAAIPYRMPEAEELNARLNEVLAVLYLTFNEGYLATSGPSPSRRDLAEDAYWLSTLLMRLLPNEPEVIGLVALMQLHLARATVRFDRAGGLILLKDQDRSRWDQRSIAEASTMLERASWLRRPGPYQLQAAIAACHAEAPSWEATDWAQILLLYTSLLIFWPTPVVRLNRAIALRHVAGAEAALAELQALADELKDYHLYHSTRAQLLRELGRESEVPAALNRALELTDNPAERALLRQRIG